MPDITCGAAETRVRGSSANDALMTTTTMTGLARRDTEIEPMRVRRGEDPFD
jgi:hypothetical protein